MATMSGGEGAGMESTEPVLVCCELRKAFGDRTAVDGVSFEIAPGECYGLLGPNGAGKTTTISMLCGLLERDGGEVTVGGEPMEHTSVGAKAAIGYVPQEIALYPELSAGDNLRFFGRLYGLSGRTLEDRVTETIAAVGLTDRIKDRVGDFSGGMKRRANIAAGLLHQPKLLVLDEPTVGVDPQSRNAIMETVLELRDRGMAILYTTHYMEEAERLCHRVGIIDGGRLIAEGTRRELVGRISGLDRIALTAGGDLSELKALCQGLDGVTTVAVTSEGLELLAPDGGQILARVVEAATRAGAALTGVEIVEPDLEAVFLLLTGKELRD